MDSQENMIKNKVLEKYENANEWNELDFYMDLLDDGIDVDMVRKYMGEDTADVMAEFCEEHGLV